MTENLQPLDTQTEILTAQPPAANSPPSSPEPASPRSTAPAGSASPAEDRVRWLNGMVTNSIQDLHPRQRQLQLHPQRPGPHPGRRQHLRPARSLSCLETESRPSRPQPHRPPRPLHHHGRRRTRRHLRPPHRPPPRRPPRPHTPPATRHTRIGTTSSYPNGIRTLERQPKSPSSTPTARSFPVRALGRPRHHRRADHQLSPPPAQFPATPEALEWLRILEGTPRYGTDIRTETKNSPRRPPIGAKPAPSTSTKAATSARRSSSASAPAATSTAPSPPSASKATLPPPAPTSKPNPNKLANSPASPASHSPAATEPVQLALGYIRREALERNQPITYPGGTATPIKP